MAEDYYNPKEAAENQTNYCHEKSLPCFAPSDGMCWACGYNIYSKHIDRYGTETGIKAGQAGGFLITGCPHCHKSYCD